MSAEDQPSFDIILQFNREDQWERAKQDLKELPFIKFAKEFEDLSDEQQERMTKLHYYVDRIANFAWRFDNTLRKFMDDKK